MVTLQVIRRDETNESITELSAKTLDSLVGFFDKYIHFPSAEARDVVALWVLHAHAIPYLDTTPRLNLGSSGPGSGKSRVLDVLSLFVPNAVQGSNVTPAVLWRALDAFDIATIMIDEVDTIFGRKGSASRHQDLQAVINNGYTRPGTVLRPQGGIDGGIAEFDVFGPIVLAGIGDLPDNIASRCITIKMSRPPAGAKVQGFRISRAKDEAEPTNRMVKQWAARAARMVAIVEPEMPDHIENRPADLWEPLFKVAQLAGKEWYDRCWQACMSFTRGGSENESGTSDPRVDLVHDIAAVFQVNDTDRMRTEDLLDALYKLPGSDWTPELLTPRVLANILGRYGVESPKTVRFGNDTAKGYTVQRLRPAFEAVGIKVVD